MLAASFANSKEQINCYRMKEKAKLGIMSPKPAIERRDPYSSVLSLSAALSEAKRARSSGRIMIKDRGLCHFVRIHDGAIFDVALDNKTDALAHTEKNSIKSKAVKLFNLPRPYVTWTQDASSKAMQQRIDPVSVVLNGVIARRDLFEPRSLAERIPVQSLKIDAARIEQLQRFPFSKEELRLLESLHVSTPIPMILWKRGLEPRHAGALLVALNVLGLWQDTWTPGLLPRIKSAVAIMLRTKRGVDDFELLGIDSNHNSKELERTFRQLCLELHPDRLRGMSNDEATLAKDAFHTVTGAYERIKKRSRRTRSIRRTDNKAQLAKVTLVKARADRWQDLLRKAELATASGDNKRARALALKALGRTPSPDKKNRLIELLDSKS